MVAHNCRIGRHNMLCSQVGIAGSTTTGDYVVMAGQVGVRDHVHIGDRAVLGAMAGVINDVPAGSRMIGIPATPERDQKVKQAAFSKLPEIRRQLKQLQRTVDAMLSGSPAAARLTLETAESAGEDDGDPRRAVA
jgi:UDP-3-O-[3-hydroxymyristoyl] glucosamine N-acyltransferase